MTGALALGRNTLPWLATGKALYDWYQAANMQADPETGEPGEMTGAQESASGYYYFGSGSSAIAEVGNFSTESAAVQLVKDWQQAPQGWSGLTWVYSPAYGLNQGCGTGKGQYKVKNNTSGVDGFYCSSYQVGRGSLAQTACADVQSKKIVGNATGGLCPGGTFTPLTQAAAADRLNNANVSGDVLARALEEILKAGGVLQDTGSHSVVGPTSVPGETTTKTSTAANGTSQVTTVTNNYNYSYSGDTVTITTTTVTQYPDGSTESETTDEPDIDACTADPTSAACVKLGDPTPSELPTNTKNVTFSPVSFSANQSCPGPVQFNALGRQLEFSYAPMCDTISTWIRALVLAGCAFIAAYVFVGGLKS